MVMVIVMESVMGSVVVLDMGLAKGSGQFVSIGGSARAVKKTNAVLPLICIFPFYNEHKFCLKPKRNFAVSLFKKYREVGSSCVFDTLEGTRTRFYDFF